MPRPAATGPVTSPYGPRRLNIPGVGTFHYGDDRIGDGNFAPEEGTIVFASYAGVFGNIILVRAKNNPQVVWNLAHHAHLNGRRIGQHVDEGEHLAPQGRTGLATGVHVHAERRVGGGNFPQSGAHTNPADHYTAPAPAGGGATPFPGSSDSELVESIQRSQNMASAIIRRKGTATDKSEPVIHVAPGKQHFFGNEAQYHRVRGVLERLAAKGLYDGPKLPARIGDIPLISWTEWSDLSDFLGAPR